jgi:hypothetical protein
MNCKIIKMELKNQPDLDTDWPVACKLTCPWFGGGGHDVCWVKSKRIGFIRNRNRNRNLTSKNSFLTTETEYSFL